MNRKTKTMLVQICYEGQQSEMVNFLVFVSISFLGKFQLYLTIFLNSTGPPESVFDWTGEPDPELSNQDNNNQAFTRKHWRLVQCQNGKCSNCIYNTHRELLWFTASIEMSPLCSLSGCWQIFAFLKSFLKLTTLYEPVLFLLLMEPWSEIASFCVPCKFHIWCAICCFRSHSWFRMSFCSWGVVVEQWRL